jgi:hypothetical protein
VHRENSSVITVSSNVGFAQNLHFVKAYACKHALAVFKKAFLSSAKKNENDILNVEMFSSV